MIPAEPADDRPPSRTAVFVDRDGVINEERRDYVTRWGEFHFLPGAIQALASLARAGLDVFVITNQSAIHRGITTPQEVRRLHRRMVAAIHGAGGRVRGVYVCPHRPDEECTCRKPQPGLLLRAAAEHGLDLAGCYLIGDKVSDMEAGLTVGCRCLLVLTGLDGPPSERRGALANPEGYRIYASLQEAVAQVIQDEALPRATTCCPDEGLEITRSAID